MRQSKGGLLQCLWPIGDEICEFAIFDEQFFFFLSFFLFDWLTGSVLLEGFCWGLARCVLISGVRFDRKKIAIAKPN